MAAAAYDTLAPFYDRFTAHHDYALWTSGLLGLAVLEEPGLVMAWRGLAEGGFGPGDLAQASRDIFSQSGGCWSRATSRHDQRHHPRETVDRCIESAGLRCVAVYGQDPAVNFETQVEELRHTKAIHLATREPCAISKGGNTC